MKVTKDEGSIIAYDLETGMWLILPITSRRRNWFFLLVENGFEVEYF